MSRHEDFGMCKLGCQSNAKQGHVSEKEEFKTTSAPVAQASYAFFIRLLFPLPRNANPLDHATRGTLEHCCSVLPMSVTDYSCIPERVEMLALTKFARQVCREE